MNVTSAQDDVVEAIRVAPVGGTVCVPPDVAINATMEGRAFSKNVRLTHAAPPVVTATVMKDTNPKDAIGIKKIGLSVLPFRVLWNVALALLEGTLKYGRHNYRASGIRASVYFDAAQRHLGSWWEGEDLASDSKLHHIDHAIASLMILRDAMIQENLVDDRPPGMPYSLAAANARAAELIELHKDKSPKHYTISDVVT